MCTNYFIFTLINVSTFYVIHTNRIYYQVSYKLPLDNNHNTSKNKVSI